MRPAESVTALTWQRFRRSKLAVGALIYVATVALIALLAPAIASDRSSAPIPFGPNTVDIAHRLHPPDPEHRYRWTGEERNGPVPPEAIPPCTDCSEMRRTFGLEPWPAG